MATIIDPGRVGGEAEARKRKSVTWFTLRDAVV
jgi:hypothetical protein